MGSYGMNEITTPIWSKVDDGLMQTVIAVHRWVLTVTDLHLLRIIV